MNQGEEKVQNALLFITDIIGLIASYYIAGYLWLAHQLYEGRSFSLKAARSSRRQQTQTKFFKSFYHSTHSKTESSSAKSPATSLSHKLFLSNLLSLCTFTGTRST